MRRRTLLAATLGLPLAPGDLPIEQPTRMDLVVNRKTAKAFGITISPAFIVRADAVID